MKVVVLWGVPGTGKTTFAREWLKKTLGYRFVENDAIALGRAVGTDRERLWTSDPEQFITTSVAGSRPIVVEYGMWANEAGIGLLRRLRDLGASPWWFDGDGDAAFARWREENVKAQRRFVDQNWTSVVAVIDENAKALADFFGPRMIRTVESGPTNVSSEAVHQRMLEVTEGEAQRTGG